MKKHWIHISLGMILLASIPLISQTATSSAPQTSRVEKQPVKKTAAQLDGDQVFQQHCMRCHDTPESFSPRISGTVVRHMRVRASLSKQEEQALLRFLNP